MSVDHSKYYLFYDGDCGFCNRWVQWVLKRDKKNQFLFAPLQGTFGQRFLRDRGLPTENLDTVYLWKPDKFYLTKSAAIIKCADVLGGSFSVLAKINFLPKAFSDMLYDLVAANRKKLGNSHCSVLSESERAKFLD